MFKIICFGVRPHEIEIFNHFNTYQFELTLVESLLTTDNITLVDGHDAVLLRANCHATETNLKYMKAQGIHYVFTRTVGTSHIDLDAATSLGIKVANVPSYSPNAIAELSLTLALNLLRNIPFTTSRTHQLDFRVDSKMFSKEVRNCTVGIIGTGKIGYTEATLFKGLGAKVLGYDLYPNDACKDTLDYVTLDELLNQSDIVSIHVPHIPGENDGMINQSFLEKMKSDAILINTARGELQNNHDIVTALEQNKIAGFATDVLPNEQGVFFKQFDAWSPIVDKDVQSLLNMYPRVLITPHIGSNTDEAVSNMVETSFKNFDDVLKTGKSLNLL
ncbi:lactate dehydrogenase [Staphylococcus sp. ACRSN]|uniref:NAD(P)-dependent oxidoreductase n=1 Tax=Staphylococcus sp. ACRSN TaxID=2918214 RepID=UPI001EF37CFA|nr:NAD(P)-dependent oxidoreductase [Staphylococcus sp. ACRSN]MCG7337901.1 lactate dehydrogenase [Staphylococcus sp. ACRSN]